MTDMLVKLHDLENDWGCLAEQEALGAIEIPGSTRASGKIRSRDKNGSPHGAGMKISFLHAPRGTPRSRRAPC